MPIAGLICRTCLTVTPPDATHWLPGGCDEPTMDPGLLAHALDRQKQRDKMVKNFREKHKNTPGPWFEVTEILGGVRDVFIRRHFPLYPEAQQFNALEVGSAVGEYCEKGLEMLGWTTQTLVYGQVLGVNLFGYIDAHLPDWTIIRDTKFKSQGAFFFQQQRGPVADELSAAQVNLYRMLAVQRGHPAATAALEIRYGSNPPAANSRTREKYDSWMTTRAPWMSEDDIGSLYPGGSKTSVRDNIRILIEAERRIEAGESPTEVARDVPMSCSPMFGRLKCPFYCGALYTCYPMAGEDVRVISKPRVRLPGQRRKFNGTLDSQADQQ